METPHKTENDLERYVALSPLQTKDERDAITTHLRHCSFCREQYRALLRMHEMLSPIDSERAYPQTEELLQRIERMSGRPEAVIIPLYPSQRKPAVNHKRSNFIALAAQTTTPSSRFTHITTLTSNDEKTIVRVLQENRNAASEKQLHAEPESKLIFHVMSDNPQNYDSVLLAIPNLPGEFLTDQDGEVTVMGLGGDLDVFRLNAFIKTASAEFILGEKEVGEFQSTQALRLVDESGIVLNLSQVGGSTSMRFSLRDADGDASIRMFVLISQGVRTVHYLENNVAQIATNQIAIGSSIKAFL